MAAKDEFLEEISRNSGEALLLIRGQSELVKYYKRLLERFELDSLTGLPGSNKYHEFKAELSNSQPGSLGAIVFDVNDLKYYNDNKGHQAGDLLLQKAAESFHHICDENGCRRPCGRAPAEEGLGSACPKVRLFRTGGDEFVALVPDCTEGDLLNIVACWKEKLAELNAADDGIRCSIAYGTAYGSGAYRLGDVLQLADERMYAEKRRMKESGVKLGEVR